jgi:small-conductance mechanosensitive channel
VEPIAIITEQLQHIMREAIAMTPQLMVAVVVLVLTYFVSWFAQRNVGAALKRTKLRPSLTELILNLVSLLIWLIGTMVAAIIVFPGLTPGSVLAGLGLGSVAIGFAFKDVFENFLAGLIILFRQEMRIGDYVECAGLEGKIEKITIRESHIRQIDGQLVIVPNAQLFKNPVTIQTDKTLRRISIICGVAYDSDIGVSRNVISKAVASCSTVSTKENPVQVFATNLGESSIDFEVAWWTGSSPLSERASRDQVVQSIKDGLDAAGIEIPFPHRTLTFPQTLQISQQD